MSQELQQLQENGRALLQSDGFFSPLDETKKITVLTEKIGDVQSQVEAILASLGISVQIITPLGKLPQPDVDSIELSVPFVVQVTENVEMNQSAQGTQVGALDVVVEVMCLLHHRPHGVTNGSPRVCRWQLTETPFTLISQQPELVYHVNFTAPISLSPRAPKPASAS